MSTFIAIIPEETLRGFTHPALDLQPGQLVELGTAPKQLELFTESDQLLVTCGPKIAVRMSTDE